nr:hypothetical protein [uncultured Dethiosulfovibrio sp.]
MSMVKIFEGLMLICFGMAWPASILKSFTSGSTKGKSLVFLVVILIGYASGIAKCLLEPSIHWPVFSLYILNTLMVSTDTALYFRNKHREATE